MKIRGLAAVLAILLAMIGCGGSGGSGHFVYVIGPGTNAVLGFQEGSGGALTTLASGFSTDSQPVSMAIHSSGKFAFVANFSAGNVSLFDRDTAKGTLAQAKDPTTTNLLGPITVGTKPISLGLNPSGQFLFVLNQGNNAPTISAFTVDSTSGNLTAVPGSPFAVPTSGPTSAATSIAVAANSKFVYVADPAQGTVSGFAITGSGPSAGALSAIAGSPFKIGTAPAFVTLDPQAKFLYVADQATNQIFAFTVDANTGAPSAVSGSPFAAGTKPVSIAIDSTGVLLVAANQGSNNVSAYSINSGTGGLSAVSGSPFATGTAPAFVTVDATNSFVYVADSGTNDITGFAISNGALKAVSGSPFNIATAPAWIVSR